MARKLFILIYQAKKSFGDAFILVLQGIFGTWICQKRLPFAWGGAKKKTALALENQILNFIELEITRSSFFSSKSNF